jgi:heme-degrading monooxygenase HmoA
MTSTQSTADTLVDWASGNWTVTIGNEEIFVARWTEFLQWTKAEAPGFVQARLIHDTADPQHFISTALWTSAADRDAWRMLPGFTEHIAACRALCDNLRASDYVEAAVVR